MGFMDFEGNFAPLWLGTFLSKISITLSGRSRNCCRFRRKSEMEGYIINSVHVE
jgi:hypothetical protein